MTEDFMLKKLKTCLPKPVMSPETQITSKNAGDWMEILSSYNSGPKSHLRV